LFGFLFGNYYDRPLLPILNISQPGSVANCWTAAVTFSSFHMAKTLIILQTAKVQKLATDQQHIMNTLVSPIKGPFLGAR
jgi:hypothetical protein